MEFESDDEAIAWMKSVVDAFRQAHEKAAIAEMEESLSGPNEAPYMPPMPGHCHPYYANRRDVIVDWLNGNTSYGYRLHLPVAPVIRFTAAAEPPDLCVERPVVVLDRRRAWWPAPYVGRPYVYIWEVATDQYGRMVSGDVRDIEYVPEHE